MRNSFSPAGLILALLVALAPAASAQEAQGEPPGRTAAWRPRYVTRARVAADGIVADVLVTVFASPSSYTGEDVAEIAAHGNPLLLDRQVCFALAVANRSVLKIYRRLLDPLGLTGPRLPKPIVAAVQGVCLTIGIELLLATDLRVAASSTRDVRRT